MPLLSTHAARRPSIPLDAVIVVAGATALGLLAIYFTPLVSDAWMEVLAASYTAPLVTGLALFALLHGRARLAQAEERRFWGIFACAFAVWFASQCLALLGFASVLGVGLALDLATVLCFFALLQALNQRPDRPTGWSSGRLTLRFSTIATALLLAFLSIYFLAVPAAVNRAAYDSNIPSFFLFIILDLVLVARFGYLTVHTRKRRWRILYGLLAVASVGWLLGDLVDCLVAAERLSLPLGTPLDLPYYLPAFAVVAATRFRNASRPSRTVHVAKALGAFGDRFQSSALPLVYAFVVPGFHVGLAASGLLIEEGRRARELTVLGALLAFVACAGVQHILLRRRNHRLESRVTALLDDEELQHTHKMEALGRLAGGVAHDFNNVLQVIRGYAEMVQGGTRDGDQDRLRLQGITDATERAATLVRQLLVFGRHQEVEPMLLRLDDEVAGVRSMLRRLIGEDVELDTSLDPETGCVVFDRGQLAQVIFNLAVNARAAMPAGGRLLIETAPADLTEDGDAPGVPPGRYAVLTVTDTGAGMDAETRERIFEPFFTTREGGSGLGLATVYGIVRQGGGAIRVDTAPGRGTRFRIFLPRVEGETDVLVPHPRPVAPRARSGETVLLVEDEDAVRRVARDGLEALGYRVLEAQDGDEAVRVAGRHGRPVDLLLTDVVLPGRSGRELAAGLEPPARAVLFMSGYDEEALLDRGPPAERSAFLRKPFGVSTLARKVREVLDRRQDAAEV